MRTIPPRILPGCPWCNYDHDPDNPCRFEPVSSRFQLKQISEPVPKIKPVRITDATGKLIAVKQTIREE